MCKVANLIEVLNDFCCDRRVTFVICEHIVSSFFCKLVCTVKSKLSLQQQYSDIALRLNAIIETATDGIITIDERGRIELVNSAAATLFGYSIEEMSGQNIKMLMPEPDRSKHDSYIGNYLHTGHRKIIGIGREVYGKRKDGAIFPLRLSISEVNLHNQRIFTGILHDLTEQKMAEKALREEKERTQQYLDVANTIFVVLNRQGEITMLNRQGCEVIGFREEDVLGKNWFDLVVHPDKREQARTNFQRLMQGSAPPECYYAEYEIGNPQHFGEGRLIAWRNALIFDELTRPTASIKSGVDITEHRAAEERIIRLNAELEKRVEMRTEELATAVNQLLDTNKQLKKEIQEREAAENALREREREIRKALEKEKELSELKSRFVSMASHEFRTPLSTILSSADLIEAYKLETQQDKRERHTGRIKAAVANLTNILNDFLSLSRFEEGKVEVQPVTFDLVAFCNETLEEISVLLKPGQRINTRHGANETLLYLDKKLLKNVLFNLLSNAIKYSEANKRIDFFIDLTEQGLAITIADQGIGIPEEEQQHLFTPFFRAHNVENIQGTGLGLNIVRRYIDLMQGQITFQSQLGKGTTFYVTIPAASPPP